MLTKNFEELRMYADIHSISSNYCSIFCLADSNKDYESYYGIPEVLTKILENISNNINPSQAINLFTSLLDCIACDGKDLTRVVWKFLAEELRVLPPVNISTQYFIDTTIVGMDLLAEGKSWPNSDLDSIFSDRFFANFESIPNNTCTYYTLGTAYYSFLTSSSCVLYAAESALFSSLASKWTVGYSASLIRQISTILKLIAEAPVHAH